MESRTEFYVYLISNANNIKLPSNKNNGFTNNFKSTLHLRDEFDVALENIIFEPKIIAIEKGDKNYGIELAARFTNKDELYHDRYKAKYVSKMIFTVIL